MRENPIHPILLQFRQNLPKDNTVQSERFQAEIILPRIAASTRGSTRLSTLFTILKRRHFLPAVARPLIRGNFSSPLLSSSNKTSIITLSMEYKRENGKVIFLYQIFLSAAPRLHRNENALRNLSREKGAMYRTIGLWQVVTRTITRQYLTRWGKLARTDWLSYSEFE